MSALTFSSIIIITLNWQFKRSKKKLDLKNSAVLGTMRQVYNNMVCLQNMLRGMTLLR